MSNTDRIEVKSYCISCGNEASKCDCTFFVEYNYDCPHCKAQGSTWCDCSFVASETGKHRRCRHCNKCFGT